MVAMSNDSMYKLSLMSSIVNMKSVFPEKGVLFGFQDHCFLTTSRKMSAVIITVIALFFIF